jgi:peptidoglycan/LPS O-acetylase OafA/YrhL
MTDTPAHRLNRNWSLDILRGVCALTVFLNHVILWSNFTPVGAVEGGLHRIFAGLYDAFTALAWPTGGQHPAVICFFVLSGYCVHGLFERHIGPAGATPPPWGGYFIRRTQRIMPVYWAGALLGLVAMAVEGWRPTGDPLLTMHAGGGAGEIAARVLGYSALWPEEVFAGNYTLGTVSVEILIYLAYPLFFLAAAANRWWLLGGVAIALQFVALALRNVVNPFVLFSGILIMAVFWYMGALAAHLRQKRGWRVRGWWLIAAWIAFLAAKQVPYFLGMNMIKQFIWGLVCMLLIVWLLDWEGRHAAQRDRPWARLLRWSGKISYPLYAMHTPVILLVNWTMLSLTGSHDYGWQLAFNLVLSVAVSVVVHHLIEKRFYQMRA